MSAIKKKASMLVLLIWALKSWSRLLSAFIPLWSVELHKFCVYYPNKMRCALQMIFCFSSKGKQWQVVSDSHCLPKGLLPIGYVAERNKYVCQRSDSAQKKQHKLSPQGQKGKHLRQVFLADPSNFLFNILMYTFCLKNLKQSYEETLLLW